MDQEVSAWWSVSYASLFRLVGVGVSAFAFFLTLSWIKLTTLTLQEYAYDKHERSELIPCFVFGTSGLCFTERFAVQSAG